jgi:hypothetical protein
MDSHSRGALLRTRPRGLALWVACAALSAACSDAPRPATAPQPHASQLGGNSPHARAAEQVAASVPPASSQRGLSWETPQGWTERPPTSLRVANFRVAGDERAECYLTLLNGDAGGLAANVNRWRTQMSQPALSADEIAALPRCELLGREAVLLDVEGTWTGMSGADRAEGRRLVGALLVQPDGSAFLKMVGPAELIAGEVERFKAVARSLRPDVE